jgi:AraC family transcriptional regulator
MDVAQTISLSFGADASGVRRASYATDRLTVERVEISGAAPVAFEVSGGLNYLALHDIICDDGEITAGGLAPRRSGDLRRAITFLPAGTAARGWARPSDRLHSFTAIHFSSAAGPPALTADHADRWAEPMIYFRDRRLEATLGKLEAALRRSSPLLPLLAESLTALAAVELVQYGADLKTPATRTGALSEAAARRVRDYIGAHLRDDITLSELAAVAGLSKFHFPRAYKSAAGRSPYREVLEMRVAAARDLLARRTPISAVIDQTGFRGAAQFSRTFRQITGVTPTAYARRVQ